MSYLRNIQRSRLPSAVYQRNRILLSDEIDEQTSDKRRKRDNLKKQNALRTEASFRSSGFGKRFKNISESFLKRVAHHLSKNRKAPDIAIRERALVSVVEKAIEIVETRSQNQKTQ